MKTCSSCGAQMPDEAVVCTVCGSPLAENQTSKQAYDQQAFYGQQAYDQQAYYGQQAYSQPAYYGQQMYVSNPADGKATASMVLGILSVVFGGIILGIIGMVLGIQARNVLPENSPSKGRATAGLICSIVGCIKGAIAGLYIACISVLAITQSLCILGGLI